MRRARVLAVALLCLPLQGCFFLFIPGSLIDAATDKITGDFGDKCIPATAKVGDPFRGDAGQTVRVRRISGPSSRCKEPNPIRAEVL